jgi:hypothetical protein
MIWYEGREGGYGPEVEWIATREAYRQHLPYQDRIERRSLSYVRLCTLIR